MPDLNITLILPSGGARTAEIPDDVNVHDLLAELTSLLQLPTVLTAKPSDGNSAKMKPWRKPVSLKTTV